MVKATPVLLTKAHCDEHFVQFLASADFGDEGVSQRCFPERAL